MPSNSSDAPGWGFFSPDGFFQPLASLTTRGLEFVSHSVAQLEEELLLNLQRERYETCALIRDELAKRHAPGATISDGIGKKPVDF
jgi:hypothetical protein